MLPNLMTQEQQVNDATDAEHYIARLAAYPHKMEQVIEGVRLRESKASCRRGSSWRKCRNRSNASSPRARGKHTERRLRRKARAGYRRTRWTRPRARTRPRRVEQAVGASVFPAYEALAAHLESLRSKATRNDGVWSAADGDAFYQFAIESNTTTTMTRSRFTRSGTRGGGARRRQVEPDTSSLPPAYRDGTVGARMRARAEPRRRRKLPTGQRRGGARGSRRLRLAIIREMTAGPRATCSALKPKASVVVQAGSADSPEKSAPAACYTPPPLDGSRSRNVLREPGRRPCNAPFGMRTLAYREAVPRVIICRAAIAQEIRDCRCSGSIIPFTAHALCWAGGQCAGSSRGKPASRSDPPRTTSTQLQAGCYRSVAALVVDTGLHAKRWTARGSDRLPA